jgi:hypothetical protein
MGWSGGTYTKGNNSTGGWTGDASLGIGIEAGRHDTQDDDFATGINACLTKDGTNSPSANLPMGGYKHTGVANASSNDEYTTQGQLKDNSFAPRISELGINVSGALDTTTLLQIQPNTTGTPINAFVHLKGEMANANGINYKVLGTSGGVETRADLGVYKHAGLTNQAAYVGLEQDNGTFPLLWFESGILRTATSFSAIGTASGTVIGTQTSDERLKEIEPDFSYGLEQVKALKPIAYVRKDDSQQLRRIGFGAQTTKLIVPEAVYDTKEEIEGEDPAETKLAMDYTSIIPVLVKALQELEAKVASLEAQVAGA